MPDLLKCPHCQTVGDIDDFDCLLDPCLTYVDGEEYDEAIECADQLTTGWCQRCGGEVDFCRDGVGRGNQPGLFSVRELETSGNQ